MHNWTAHFKLLELRKVKLSNDFVYQQLHDGKLIRLTGEIAMPADRYEELPPWQRATAMAMAVGKTVDKAVVSGVAAALLHGLPVLSYDGPIDLTLPSGKQPAPHLVPPGRRYHSAALPKEHIIEVRGVRVTTLARTILDITRWEGIIAGVIALEGVLHRHPHLSLETLRHSAFGRPHPGSRAVREVFHLARPCIESPLESWARVLILQSDLECTVRTQVKIGAHRVDMLIDDHIIVEVDGAFKYDGTTFGKTDDVLRMERKREKELQNRGFWVLRVERDDLIERPDGTVPLIEMLRGALARGRGLGLGA